MLGSKYKTLCSRGSALSLAALLIGAAPVVLAAEPAGRVTAATGAEFSAEIADGEHVKVGEDSACSILLDDDAVVELCGETSVVFTRDRDSNRRIVSLDRGEIRLVVEPRDVDERIEIHTPAAIATLLGTIVHVSVDATTGATTIASAQSRVSVRSDRGDVRGTTLLTAGEQVTVEPGAAPPATPERLDPREFSELGGCLVDFHTAAADRDHRAHAERSTDRLTAHDAANPGALPGASPGARPRRAPGDVPGDALTGQEGICVATDCEPHRDPGSGSPPPPPVRNLRIN